jgi:chorismate mutase/prephenate dehydratase
VRDEVGALYNALKPFADHAINLLRIESRPLKGRPWEYLFFIDVAGHIHDEPIDSALREIQPLCSLVKVLGSYISANHATR